MSLHQFPAMLTYSVFSEVFLSLEDFYNRGLKPAKVKEIIENTMDPGSNSYLYCRETGINNNFSVRTCLRNKENIHNLVLFIRELLRIELSKLSVPEPAINLNDEERAGR